MGKVESAEFRSIASACATRDSGRDIIESLTRLKNGGGKV